MVVQMINVGEQTGALDQMLSKIADFYEDEVDTAVAGLMKLIEPVMITVLGVVIGTIVAAMYLPLYSILTQDRLDEDREIRPGRPPPPPPPISPMTPLAHQLRWYIAIRVVAIVSVLLPFGLLPALAAAGLAAGRASRP